MNRRVLQTFVTRLRQELNKRDLTLLFTPEPNQLASGDLLVVFGAEQKVGGKDKPLVSGCGPLGMGEDYGNSPSRVLANYMERVVESFEVLGVPRQTFYDFHQSVGRGKIWPTFWVRFTREEFEKLRPTP